MEGVNMRIVEFKHEYIEMAVEIALENYEEERKIIPILPVVNSIPDLSHFAENGLGIAALEGDYMLGYLGVYHPIEDAFGTTNVRGTFSPLHAHGVILSNRIASIANASRFDRGRIYSMLYQEAAKKWVQAGILSHAVALYAHDQEAERSFFWNGFGLRCIDAICPLDKVLKQIDTFQVTNTEFEYLEIPRKEWGMLLDYQNNLIDHLGQSPSFMNISPIDEVELYRRNPPDMRYFVAKIKGQCAAYIKIAASGENFITEEDGMVNICGAYCNPSYRGIGVYHNLLSYLMSVLRNDGYQLIGVDFESFNPTARGFWLKYFTEYTHSMVRRIDDKAIINIKNNTKWNGEFK